MEVGEKFKLKCGHVGKVIWLSSDLKCFAVMGSHRTCDYCGKKTTGGRTPKVYLISVDDLEEERP